MHDLDILIESGRRLIVLETEREGCFIQGFTRLAKRSHRAYYQWRITQGLERLAPGFEVQAFNREFDKLFGQILSTDIAGVYVLVDFHHHLTDPLAIRFIKDVLLQTPQHTLILLSATVELPDELRSFATHYKLPLPTPSTLKSMVTDLAISYKSETSNSLKATDKDIVDRLVTQLCGLSETDAERLARHAIWNDGVIDQTDINEIAKHKFELLNENNVLNLELDYEQLDNIAGYSKLKQWLSVRRSVFLGEVKLPGGDIPKGMLLLGVQGCGKSMAAKAVAGSWELPLLHLDFGTLYNRFYGQTEENLRSALEVAEKMAPCILWLDEVEKGMSAVSSSDDVSKRLLGTFLTWLAEKQESVFVVATANDVSALPPELLRKGRFDEVFFVDLPNLEERRLILEIHLKRRDLTAKNLDLAALAEQTQDFSGAELEQLIVSSIYQSYSEKTALSTDMLLSLAENTQPLSVLMSEKIQALQQWAQGRAVKVS